MCASHRINNRCIVQINVNMDCHFSYCRKLSSQSSRQLMWLFSSASVLLPPIFSLMPTTHSTLTLVWSCPGQCKSLHLGYKRDSQLSQYYATTIVIQKRCLLNWYRRTANKPKALPFDAKHISSEEGTQLYWQKSEQKPRKHWFHKPLSCK